MKKYRFLLLVPVAGIVIVVALNYNKLDLISGFSAKSVASAHFISGRDLKMIEDGDNDIDLVRLSKNVINTDEKSVTSTIFGLNPRTAVYRDGLGAVLIDEQFDVSKPYPVPKRTIANSDLAFPYGNDEPTDTIFGHIDYKRLNNAVSESFDANGKKEKRTRSLLVIYKDKIIAEKYDTGFTKDSKILGWSMTKSITATIFGILHHQNKIDISNRAPVEEWQNDDRRGITLSHLLQMNSGLEWEEQYDKISDATTMLYLDRDMTQRQIGKPMRGKPAQSWNYSSGTTNLLSGILRSHFKSHQEYLDFWYTALIDKIGMHSMIIEADMSGNYVGSSYGWATTRDWAKFGLLYLHNGNWNGQQIFDESWVDFVTTPTPTSNGRYGGHFWLNAGGHYPDAPKDLYSANGFQGQMVYIIPSKDLVIVRMGLLSDNGFDFNSMLKEIVGSIGTSR
ncbi:MAG: serine hydrolase [Flavobacterium sp.]|nr:serine hydrolase [Flavobacterium sp.]